jgi:hypothetical protein
MTTFKKLPTAPPVANNQTATAMSATEDIWDFRFQIWGKMIFGLRRKPFIDLHIGNIGGCVVPTGTSPAGTNPDILNLKTK